MRISDWSSDVCSSDLFQKAVVDCLIDRTRLALEAMPEATALVVAGGVASNQAIRAAIGALADAQGLPFIAPPGWLWTDKAAVIARAGADRFGRGVRGDGDVAARGRWAPGTSPAPGR